MGAVKVPFFRTGYNYDRDAVSNETGLKCEDESLTVQSEKEDADINTIVRRFGLTGVMPENPRVPMYGDFTGLSDYRSALEAVREADRNFMELTPEVRARFDNNPQMLLEFVSNEGNRAEAQRLGLLKATPAASPAASPAPAGAGGAVPSGGSGGAAPSAS